MASFVAVVVGCFFFGGGGGRVVMFFLKKRLFLLLFFFSLLFGWKICNVSVMYLLIICACLCNEDRLED